jgi:hypothetical protein
MINVQQLTATLAQLPDSALQQYAQMHKEDPYTLALAVSESSRRKAMRASAQPQPGQEQGTVADEELAGMAPAGLGAAAPQGYADGGDIEAQRESDRAGIREFGQAVWDKMKRAGAATADIATMPLRGLAGAYDTGVVRPMRALGADAGYISPHLVPEGADVSSQTPFYDTMFRGRPAPADTGDETGRLLARYPADVPSEVPASAGLSAAADATLPPASAGPVSASSKYGLRSATPASTAPAPGAPTDMGLNLDQIEKDAYARNAKITDAARSAGQQDLAELKQEQADRGVYGASKEVRIKEQQGELASKEDHAKKMALLQAGLSILSADPSKGAFAAIGSGALEGLKGYKGDMADIEKKRSALMDKLDQLDDLRRQEAVADSRERRGISSRIRQAEVEGAKLNAQIGDKMGIEVKPAVAMATFKELQANWRSQQDNAARLQAANIQAGATMGAAQLREKSAQQDRNQRDADTAFKNNPRVQMLIKKASDPLSQLNPAAEQQILSELSQLQADTYKQYGLTMASPAPASDPNAGWGKPTVKSP